MAKARIEPRSDRFEADALPLDQQEDEEGGKVQGEGGGGPLKQPVLQTSQHTEYRYNTQSVNQPTLRTWNTVITTNWSVKTWDVLNTFINNNQSINQHVGLQKPLWRPASQQTNTCDVERR